MSATLADLAIVFIDLEARQVAKGLFEHRARIELGDVGGPAGLVRELLGSVALNENPPARSERALHAGKNPRTLHRGEELHKNADDHVELILRPCPAREIRLLGAQHYAALRGERLCFLQRRRREVD